jgi:arsenite methyltransferase
MKAGLAKLLVDPVGLRPLHLSATESQQDEILSGTLQADDGSTYPIRVGIPRFVLTQDEGQVQTSESFGFKWKKRDTYDSPSAKKNAIRWYIDKYGFESIEAWTKSFASREAVLDVGCGSGFSSSLWLDSTHWNGRTMWVGADISEAIDVAQERLGHIPNCHFIQADALQLPFPDGSFDTIFSEGVLHHTPSTRLALLSAARVLGSKGKFNFYVYRRKSPVREFTDDYIREQIAVLSDEEAWEAMRPLTTLGKVLAETKTKIELDEDIPLLGIRAGEHDIQRLIYWHFAKLYWNPELSFDENVHINFDWYRPKYAHRQTAEEVRAWCAEANLEIQWFHEQESGFTVRAVKK